MRKKKEKLSKLSEAGDSSKADKIGKCSELWNVAEKETKTSGQNLDCVENTENDFLEKLKFATNDLIYISETDADVLPFLGKFAEEVSAENLLTQIRTDVNTKVEELDYQNFFAHPTKIQEWFDEEATATAEKYQMLKIAMEENLTNIKYFKVGKTEIKIYVVGLDKQKILIGIKTDAVET